MLVEFYWHLPRLYPCLGNSTMSGSCGCGPGVAGLSVSSSELLCIFLRKKSQLLGEYRTCVEQPLAITAHSKAQDSTRTSNAAILPEVPGKNWRQMWSVTEDQVTL